MDKKKLNKIAESIAAARRKVNTHRELESIAHSLGRKRVKRGKEPTYVSEVFPELHPISIPDHGGGKTITRGTAANILNDLEGDIYRFERELANPEEDDEDTEEEL